MAVEIDGGRVEREIDGARRELALTGREFDRAVPRAISATIRRARTAVVGARGILYNRGLTPARIRRRVFASGARRGERPATARLWLGANDVPAEYFRGNFVGRRKPPTRGLTTKRDGAIPRSFSIRARGRPLYLRRISPTRYIRITSSVLEDMEAARMDAANAAPGVLRDEIGKAAFAIRRTAARRSTR